MSKKVIKPSVSIEGHTHPFETLEASKRLPEFTAVGVIKSPDSNTWVSYTVKIKGDKVVSIEVDEPNMKAVAVETAKIAFVHNFLDLE